MTPVMLLGQFREFGYDTAPSLAEVRGRPSPHQAAIVRYLASGHPFIVSPGLERDVFEPTKHADSLTILTDGRFAWHRLLAYYVERHEVAIPPALEAHIVASRFEVPAAVDVRTLRLVDE